MTREALHSAIHAEPFIPFRLHMANGRTVDVPHPEWIMHHKTARTAVWMSPQEEYRIIDIGLVLELEHIAPVEAGTVAPDPNGGE